MLYLSIVNISDIIFIKNRMVDFEPHELLFFYKLLWVIIPVTVVSATYFFIFFNRKIDKLERIVSNYFDKLDSILEKEQHRNKEFRQGHYNWMRQYPVR